MSLPPAPPGQPPSFNQAVASAGVPPGYMPPAGVPLSAPMPSPPAAPTVAHIPSPISVGHLPVPGFKPARPAMLEAITLCKHAISVLQFQDSETAIANLNSALVHLTQPPMPSPDDSQA